MKDLFKKSAFLGAALLALTFVTSLIPGNFGSTLQILMLPALLLFAWAAMALFIIALRKAYSLWPDWRRAILVACGVPAILSVSTALILPTLWAGNKTYIWGIMILGRGWLDRTVAEAQRQPAGIDDPGGVYDDQGIIPVLRDNGPPVRVAFVTNPGFLDNWSGIVFDPTGKVELARGWDASGQFYAPTNITGLFSGDVVECSPLIDAYYYCSFT
ncbi:hypothetical protein [Sphingomonas cavernae]|uniref:Uncharacterized protein n=1 Tax=Sphingomonas cavernae TaxID=2320861 RepID=A0A418WR43_9SPHN|nr:hypothetical protein [Sphingomonas cavernae]RJF93713.1 hypothetical protein D3876_05300 [Sphingomonas cavernae]